MLLILIGNIEEAQRIDMPFGVWTGQFGTTVKNRVTRALFYLQDISLAVVVSSPAHGRAVHPHGT